MSTRLAVLGLAFVLAACGPTDTYPMPVTASGGARLPAAVGQPRHTVVLWIPARAGDRLELVDAEAIGTLDGTTVELFASRPVAHADGTFVIGEALEPLEGVVIEPRGETPDPNDTVGIVVELMADAPGRYEVTAIRLRYRLNDDVVRVREGIDVVMTLCVEDPAPETCPELED
ncbi:MAG TPA: hypothetical protein VFO50_00955 [Candidatus Limnocylindrales bacterium]|nr:hypothetical protein [Candidatus Limnocylindrales bacterium]